MIAWRVVFGRTKQCPTEGKAGCYRFSVGPVPHGPRYRVSARAKGIKIHKESLKRYSTTLGGVGLMGAFPNYFSSALVREQTRGMQPIATTFVGVDARKQLFTPQRDDPVANVRRAPRPLIATQPNLQTEKSNCQFDPPGTQSSKVKPKQLLQNRN